MNKRFKINYVVIPLITIFVASLGSYFTSLGMCWYHSQLKLPAYTPPKIMFPIMWNIIFTLATIAALYVWNRMQHMMHFGRTMQLFAVNALANVAWTFLFFKKHWLMLAAIDVLLLLATIIALIYYIGLYKKKVALLLVPYILWVAYASILSWHIVFIN